MNPKSRTLPLLALAACAAGLLSAPASAADPDANLITNGNFETDSKTAGWPDGWGGKAKDDSLTWEVETGNHFLRLHSTEPGKTVMIYRQVVIPAGAKAVQFSCRLRAADLKPGKEAWYDARVMMDFKDGGGTKLKPGPAAPYLRKSTDGWVERTARFVVPEGTKTLDVMPSLFQVNAGTLDVDDVVVKVVPLDAVPGAVPKDIKPADLEPEAPQKAKWPALLHVEGNRLKSADGKVAWLQGVNVVSLEFSPRGEYALRSAQVAVDDWKANAIRLPVKEDYWFGRSGPSDGGAAYRAIVDSIITLVANRGAYVILDLHRYRAPLHAHVDFWKDAAAKYKDHPAVLFDILNEPHGTTWEVWRDGGFVSEKETPEGEDAFLTPAEKAAGKPGFHSPGMQALVAAVRGTGAKNVIVAGGLDYAYDLSGIVKGFALDDLGGGGIMYSTHIYNWKRDWAGKVLPTAEKYPIFVGEVGADIHKMDFIPAGAQEDPYTWVPDMLGFIQKHQLNWTAFSFHPKATPVIISDWSYAPTPFWGSFVRAALRGAKFEMNKMR